MTFAKSQPIVLASGNAGKIREIQALLAHHPIVPQAQFNVAEVDESASTFVENAIAKARNAARHCGLPAIADDSGLAVDALGGAPGVYSARYAGSGASDADNVQKLLKDMQDIPDTERSARFICAIVFMEHALDPRPIIAEGVWEGSILHRPTGNNGFGYDPVFWVPGERRTSAELAPERKNLLSHRGQALRKLSELMRNK
jgi:XTP/dITP diphosphohydrolase